MHADFTVGDFVVGVCVFIGATHRYGSIIEIGVNTPGDTICLVRCGDDMRMTMMQCFFSSRRVTCR